jgi:trehalose 6-phosphate phosphatase
MAREIEVADPLSGLDPENVALFLDIDGTLLDIAPVPEAVKVPDGLGPALSILHRRLNGALAIISGRPIKQIDQLFKPLVLPASGEHGFEIRRIPHEKVERFQPPTALNLLRPSVTELARRLPGLIPEFKTGTIALHYRQVPQQADAVRAAIEALLKDSPEFAIQTGKMVFEIKPRDVDKGRAIEQLMLAPPFENRVPVFVGDDDTDEHGFAAVRKAGGRAIQVGADRPGTDMTLPSPAHVRAWLMRLAEQMSSAAA